MSSDGLSVLDGNGSTAGGLLSVAEGRDGILNTLSDGLAACVQPRGCCMHSSSRGPRALAAAGGACSCTFLFPAGHPIRAGQKPDSAPERVAGDGHRGRGPGQSKQPIAFGHRVDRRPCRTRTDVGDACPRVDVCRVQSGSVHQHPIGFDRRTRAVPAGLYCDPRLRCAAHCTAWATSSARHG